jgi:two-component system, sensor histidine kinase LadS
VTHSRRARAAAREDRLRLSLLTQRLTLEQQQRADQQQFLDMLGHELKTPLMTIRLASHALRRWQAPSDDDKVLQRIVRIEASVEAMNQVLERVLEANRLGDSSLPLNVQWFTVGALLEAVHDAMAEPDRLRRQGDLMLQVHSDVDLLRVIVGNLLDNACKYSPPGSLVSVAVQSDARAWCLTVRNQLGLAGAPDPDRVFRKHHRAEEAKCLPGAGLGLWLGHNLAQHLGGSLGVRTVHEHVEFSLCLPLTVSS